MTEPDNAINPPAERLLPWRRPPMQQRSRDRVERILSVASKLIAKDGSNQLKMSDVAELAGISIGSLYQYFPDKSAIIRTLAARYNAASRVCIEQGLAQAHDLAGLIVAFSKLVDDYYAIFQAEPVMRDIWSGTQSDKKLADVELAESRLLGRLLTAARQRVDSVCDVAKFATTSFLIMHLGEATMRLAISLPREEGDAVVEAYKQMALREISHSQAV
jgi:AcrR family transcriptional regulator